MRYSLGVELEMPVARRVTGVSHCVGPYFHSLHDRRTARGEAAEIAHLGGRAVALATPLVHSSLDNAFNNLESAIGPVFATSAADGLARLEALIRQEIADVTAALAAEGAGVLNFAQHPSQPITEALYRDMRVPRPIYDEWVTWRGWDHSAGLDAKAHNGPTTGVPIGDAVTALNVMLAAAPAFIALYANSPFEAGRLTGLKETRLTLWPRMFGGARHAGDDRLHRLPETPFRDLRDYFTWMHGPGTAMHVVPLPADGSYKTGGAYARVLAEPPLLAFLRGESWQAVCLDDGAVVTVKPGLRHLDFAQFGHFLDARIRFGFDEMPDLDTFHAAWARDGGLEDLFARTLAYSYIEGRAPGTNLADADLAEAAGEAVAASVAISPSALQMGLLNNLEAARGWLERLDWRSVAALRAAAMRDGLAGEAGDIAVRDLCGQVIALAADGLDADSQWMLGYPLWVLRTGRTGADRALAFFEAASGPAEERLRALCLRRMAVAVPDPHALAVA